MVCGQRLAQYDGGLMVFKLDEDLLPLVGEPLTSAGHDVRTVVGQGWSGLPDHEVWPRASAEGAIFVTADKGFSDLRQYPPGTHPGLVVLRPARESIVDFRELLEMLLQ